MGVMAEGGLSPSARIPAWAAQQVLADMQEEARLNDERAQPSRGRRSAVTEETAEEVMASTSLRVLSAH